MSDRLTASHSCWEFRRGRNIQDEWSTEKSACHLGGATQAERSGRVTALDSSLWIS